MEYKVLIKLFVPEIEQSYELYIPINKTISQVLILLNKVVNETTLGVYPIKGNLKLINRRSGKEYSYKDIVRLTDIKNGTELIII